MKKFLILVLAALMFVSPLTSAARASEMLRRPDAALENNRNRRRDDRRGRDHGRNRHTSKNNGAVVGVIGGLIVGGMIGAAVADSRARQPVTICDPYGRCWQEYR